LLNLCPSHRERTASQSISYELLPAGSRCDADPIFQHSDRGRAVLSRIQLFAAVREHARYSLLAVPLDFQCGRNAYRFCCARRSFRAVSVLRRKTNFLLSWLIGLSVACTGVMTLKAGMFPMPDPRHNSWGFLQNLTIITPHLMLIDSGNGATARVDQHQRRFGRVPRTVAADTGFLQSIE
jgi:hypothetical protein